MGRRKIEIEPLTDDRNRTVTFVKRKAGLFKKAYELAVLCQVDLAVIIVGNNDKVYEFSSVDTGELMKKYQRVKIHELKLPENYGKYKKKLHLLSGSGPAIQDDLHDMDVANADSDYDSDTPDPKRKKAGASELSIYSKMPVSSRYAPMAQQPHGGQEDLQTQRPVLRVQIPLNVKTEDDSAKTITALDTINTGKHKLGPPDGDHHAPQLNPANAARYSFRKFKSPETKKVPQLPLPISQLLSPILTTAPPLPSGVPFFLLYNQLPLGQYPPAILPTPVFNQVFNQWLGPGGGGIGLGSVNAVPHAGAHSTTASGTSSEGGVIGPSGGGSAPSSAGVGGPTGPLVPPGRSGPSGPAGATGTAGVTTTAVSGAGGGNGGGAEEEAPKFRTPHQQLNGDQTPMSALPSRYMNDIFPSPSTMYPAQEWPTGMTPYTSSMPHYFVGIPSASGATPLPVNMYANARLSLQGQPHRLQFQPSGQGGSPPQGQGPEYGQYYKR